MAHRALMGLSKVLPKRISNVKPFEYLLVLDFEATCLENQILRPQEIIEFPCLVMSTKDWEVKDVFHEYVKPRVHTQLSTFCTELTGIMQETVDNEKHFPQVFLEFNHWLSRGRYFEKENKSAFVTCGDWDLRVMLPNQCKLDEIDLPHYCYEWINLKTLFYSATKHYPRSLKDMLNHLNMEFQGKNHCGLDDAHNMTRVIRVLSKKHRLELSITSDLTDEKESSAQA
ncbi:hypothetical protein QAD02_011857 [Eretmocerus hayati]|uniref:Uncharacterized protein n=1 Tax=Eretmocerus hayati TaxID=131215 RepID=A0ACC2NY32_9HYME|nr:hypothetical protein QAD02_011857 [Eretmocerus hayati]